MDLTRRQRVALTHPCGLAPETLDQRFWANEKAPIRGMLTRSGLTVNRWLNIFDGIPVWEVSVSIGAGGAPYPMRQIGPRLGAVLVAKARELVAGVGDHAAGFWHTDSVSVHFRCPLTPDELEALDPEWLACPAVHRGGNEDRMTKDPPWVDATT